MRFLAVIVSLLSVVAGTVFTAASASASTDTKMYVTGYSYWDNDPPGSGEIAYPKCDGYATLHCTAAGKGTYSNPITVAVGIVSGSPQFKPGTKFYIPALGRYFIVEDSCAACGSGSNGYKWIDVWVGGSGVSTDVADACMNKITGVHRVIVSPPNGYAVYTAAPIINNGGCTRVRSDALVLGANT